MIYSHEVEKMCPVAQGVNHGAAPIPEEAKWVKAKEIKDISGLTHGVGSVSYTHLEAETRPKGGQGKRSRRDTSDPVSYTHLSGYVSRKRLYSNQPAEKHEKGHWHRSRFILSGLESSREKRY